MSQKHIRAEKLRADAHSSAHSSISIVARRRVDGCAGGGASNSGWHAARERERGEEKKVWRKVAVDLEERGDGGMKHKRELNRDVGYLQTECRELESWHAFLGITAAVSASLRFRTVGAATASSRTKEGLSN